MESSALSRLQVVSQDLEDLGEIARSIIDFSEGLKFWVFDGEMGEGRALLGWNLADYDDAVPRCVVGVLVGRGLK